MRVSVGGRHRAVICAALVAFWAGAAAPAAAEGGLGVTLFKQAVAEHAADDDSVAAFYRNRGFEPLWTGADESHRDRRAALIAAIDSAGVHGLPAGRYDVRRLMTEMRSARGGRERGRLEIDLTRAYLQFARDLQSGILTPGRVDSDIKREVSYRDPADLLARLEAEPARAVFRSLTPASYEYARLMRAKMTLERVVARGGWGPAVPSTRLERGASGAEVAALRDRLIAMGYLNRTASARYDAVLEAAVQAFQADHGLAVDGISGGETASALNIPALERLKSVLVAMERERWLNGPGGLGQRHIRVNLTEYMARIYDDGKVTFETKAVIGAGEADRRTPEFSDEMDHMVINPSWYVPRSIVVNEYLPLLRRNPYSVGHMEITDRAGRKVNRGRGFSQYSSSSFPYAMRQPPGPKNALGQVKFMFPNKYNIYLHDTPSQHLFSNNQRAFSHGCVRLDDPYEFAYALLAKQTDDPENFFQSRLRTRAEVRVNLETPVPVHLIYRTAFTEAKGRVQYRADTYGRDARIWAALEAAGVVAGGAES